MRVSLAGRRPPRLIAASASTALLASLFVVITPAPALAAAPTITTGAAQSAAENQTAVVDVDATDPEGDTEGAGLTYAVTGGADHALFSVDADTGVLTFNAAPDFENPGDADTDNVYDVEVTVTDSEAIPLTDSKLFNVTVTDGNDAPEISTPAVQSAAENQTAVVDITATDQDGDTEGAGLTYAITGGADQALVSVDASTGVLTFNSAPDFESPGDADTDNVYEVEVTVTDSGTGPLTDAVTFLVTVTDANDAPSITTPAAQSAAENQIGVATLTASDADVPPQTLTWSETGGADAGLLSITAGGVVTFDAAPDFETLADDNGDGVYELEVTVTDDGVPPLSATQTVLVTVTDVNEPPVVSPATFSIPVTAASGSAVGTVDATDVDAGDAIAGFAIVAGDPGGVFAISASGTITVANATGLAVGSHPVTVRAIDTGGTTGDAVITIDVTANSAPVLAALGDQSAPEGTLVTLPPAGFSDADPGDTHTAMVDWGDGTVEPGVVDQAADTIAGSHVYADDGSYTITVTVTDVAGDSDVESFTATAINAAATVTGGAAVSGTEGTTITVNTISFNDPGTLDTHTATIDWGDGSPAEPATALELPFGPPGNAAGLTGFVTGSHVYGSSGTYVATACVTDDDGGVGCGTLSVSVANALPVVIPPPSVGGIAEPATAALGTTTFTDAGSLDIHTATIDWGDGSPIESGTVTETPVGPPGSTSGMTGTVAFGTHDYPDSGVYTVTICVTDDDGGTACEITGVFVDNVDPSFTVVRIRDAAGNDTVNFETGDEVFFSGEFVDPGSDTHTLEVDWGDGTVTTTTVPSGDRTFSESYVYSAVPGSGTFYTAQITLRDDDGGAAAVAGPVVVRDPAPPPPSGPDTVGLFDPSQGRWHLRDESGNVTSFFFGNPADVPFMGDWDCDGIATPGLYRQSDGLVYLTNVNAASAASRQFFFGNPGDLPLAGDFDGDGCDTVSIYRPGEQRIYIINELGENNRGLGAADTVYTFGNPGDKPFVGDFDGNGIDEVGLHRESTGLVYYRLTHTPGAADAQFTFGDPGDRIVAGDWIEQGFDTPALFRPSLARLFLRHSNSAGVADDEFLFGESTFIPLSGKYGLR